MRGFNKLGVYVWQFKCLISCMHEGLLNFKWQYTVPCNKSSLFQPDLLAFIRHRRYLWVFPARFSSWPLWLGLDLVWRQSNDQWWLSFSQEQELCILRFRQSERQFIAKISFVYECFCQLYFESSSQAIKRLQVLQGCCRDCLLARCSRMADQAKELALQDLRKRLVDHKEIEARVKAIREQVKSAKVEFEKTEDDLKALQSVGQIVGEVLRQLDEGRCESKYLSHFFRIEIGSCDRFVSISVKGVS